MALASAACVSVDDCWAVGYDYTGSDLSDLEDGKTLITQAS
jgi:hypothetical protein